MLLYGRNPKLPGISALSEVDTDLMPVQEHLLKIIKAQDELVEKVDAKFNQTQTNMKKRWDKGKM